MGFRASVGASTSSFMVMGLLWTLPYVGHHDLWAIIGDWALGIWDFRDVKDAMVGLKPYHASFITNHV